MWQEFKEFIARGNVMDLAVAVIMGSAFSAIVSALVDNIIMPLVGVILGGLDFSNLSITVGSSVIQYGAFIQAVVDFLIISVILFLMVKTLNIFNRKKDKEEEAKEESDEDKVDLEIKLLTEIRDSLAEKK